MNFLPSRFSSPLLSALVSALKEALEVPRRCLRLMLEFLKQWMYGFDSKPVSLGLELFLAICAL